MTLFSFVRFFLRCLPFNKGKQTFANFIFTKAALPAEARIPFQYQNVDFSLDLSDRIQAIFYMTGLYEPKTVEAIARNLVKGNQQSPLILDVGANVGLIALQLKNQFPNAQLHLFEADPSVFKQLQQNISLNKLSSMRTNNQAVSDKHGETLTFVKSLAVSESGWGRLQNAENRNAPGATYQVGSVSIDSYLSDLNISAVDLLKIDVEGAEELVLRGAEQTLQRKLIRAIVCEINPEALAAFSSSPQKIFELLERHGYQPVETVEMNVVFTRESP